MDWRGGEHGKKSAQEESGGLSWERPDIAGDATGRMRLPELAEPAGKPSEPVTVAETSRNPRLRVPGDRDHSFQTLVITVSRASDRVRVLTGMALRVGEQNGKDDKDDRGLAPKRLGELESGD